MEKSITRGNGRSLRSTLGKALSLGVCSALLMAGALVVSAGPAAAVSVVTVTSTSPTSLSQGATAQNVTITGTGFVSGTGLAATFSASGITVNSTTYVSATDVTANVTVSGTATLGAGNVTVTNPDTGTGTGTGIFTVYSTTATKLGFTTEPLATTVAGATLTSFQVTVENGAGTLASNGSADVIVITSACTLAGTTNATSSSGVATFGALVIDGGTSPCTLIATDSTETLTTATSSGVTVTAGAATKVVFTTEPPATVLEAAALTTFKVSVEDVYGNIVTSGTGATDTVTITSTCTLGGTTAAVAAAGGATFSALTLTATGSCTLTATDSSRTLTSAVSTGVDSQGAQSALTVSSLTGYLGSPLTLTTAGGSGTGAVTYTAVVGTAAGCVVTGSSLTVTSLGTCIVTATKAASLTNLAISSLATMVTFVIPGPKATKVDGFVVPGKTSKIIIVGSNFSGRPSVTSHAGTTALVYKDTGRLLFVKVTVKAGEHNGTYTFTIKLANGKTCKVKYVQKA